MQDDGRLQVGYDKAKVRGAPSVETGTDQPLTAEQLTQLYQHYQLQQQAPARQPEQPPQWMRGGPEVVRLEERLRVGAETQPAGVGAVAQVSDQREPYITVPGGARRGERGARADHRGDRGDARPDIRDDQREMELRAEHPVVAKEQVPVERVRLDKDEVVEEEPVNAQVRRELVDADVPDRARRNR